MKGEVVKRGWVGVCLMGGAVLILGIGCGPIEGPVLVDDEGEPVPVPEPLEDWLRVISVEPLEEVSVRPVVAIEFNAYLDPATFSSFGAIQMNSGGLGRWGYTDYRMTRKTLLFRPNGDLEPELEYRIVMPGGAGFRSVVGSPLFPATTLPVVISTDELAPEGPIQRGAVRAAEVEEIFEGHCNQCHGDPQWQLPSLEPERLVGARSGQVDRFLVEPYHPGRSYLMHKILPDYPDRRFTVQPPPWSEAEALTMEQIEKIEDWIANGAPR